MKHILNTREHKAGDDVTHKMVEFFACTRIKDNCAKGKCSNSKVCNIFNLRICELFNDDIVDNAIRAKICLALIKCNKKYDEPGDGVEFDEKRECIEHMLSSGKCKHFREVLELVYKQSGACQHKPGF